MFARHEAGGGGILASFGLRVFYATLAQKALPGPVGRALLHCLEEFIR
jgi:hypothetical protein